MRGVLTLNVGGESEADLMPPGPSAHLPFLGIALRSKI